MSTEILKSVTIKPEKRTAHVVSACSNVTPRTYSGWDPIGPGMDFDKWVRALASDLFGGMARFLPSCESWAHEAYLRTCDEMGDWRRAYEATGDLLGTEYEEYRKAWCDRYVDILLNGRPDRRKFVLTHNGIPVTIGIRSDCYGSLSGRIRRTSCPKEVSWIRQRICTSSFRGVGAQPVA